MTKTISVARVAQILNVYDCATRTSVPEAGSALERGRKKCRVLDADLVLDILELNTHEGRVLGVLAIADAFLAGRRDDLLERLIAGSCSPEANRRMQEELRGDDAARVAAGLPVRADEDVEGVDDLAVAVEFLYRLAGEYDADEPGLPPDRRNFAVIFIEHAMHGIWSLACDLDDPAEAFEQARRRVQRIAPTSVTRRRYAEALRACVVAA